MKNIREILSDNIKKYRDEQHMSQEDLALQCDLHRTYISDIERCTRNVSIDNISKIADALKVTPADLFKEENQ